VSDHEDFTDPQQHKRRKKKHEIRLAQESEDLSKVLSEPHGRRLVWRILEQTKLLAPDMFTGNSTTFYNLGKRDIGLWLYTEIMASDPKAFIDMMNDQLKETLDG
tara:strand:- start:282 stop:596 length:315 start_codon:yes stop_codon:yes gene_type:complete